MDIKITFAERLIEIMIEKDLTVSELGREMHILPSKISEWRIHNSDVQLTTLMTLKNYFNCSIEFLSGRIDIDTETLTFTKHNFVNSLKLNLLDKNITEYRMIKDLKLSRSIVYNWKTGGDPRLSTLSNLADYLDCTIDYLVGRINI